MPVSEDVRSVVKRMYPNPTWEKRVDKMPDSQIYSIYVKHMREVQEKVEIELAQIRKPERTLSSDQGTLF